MPLPSGDALWMITTSGSPSYGADELRRNDVPLQFPGADPLGARTGLRPGHVAASLSGTTLTVGPCAGVIYASTAPFAANSGVYRWTLLSGTENLTAADGTNPRIDRVVVRIQDHDIDALGQRRAIAVIKVGTPAAVPVAPSVESWELDVATILVPATGTPAPTLTLSQQYMVALGGTLPVPTRSALPSVGLFDGMAAYIIDEQAHVICHSGAWVAVGNRKGYSYWQTVYFTSSGTFAKASYPGLKAVKVLCQGGGGGGGGTQTTVASEASSSGGGGGGMYAERIITAANLATSESVTVGGGGAGGAAAATGGTGGTSSFGTWVVAPGGSGGFSRAPSTSISVSSGAAPVTLGATGALIIPGGGGGGGIAFPSGTDNGLYGTGGSSRLGGSGRSARGPSTAAEPGANYGSGGSGNVNGASTAGKTGGAGAPGIVIVEVLV